MEIVEEEEVPPEVEVVAALAADEVEAEEATEEATEPTSTTLRASLVR